MDIKISKGLDIPIEGKPSGKPQIFVYPKESSFHSRPLIALDLKTFDQLKFKVLVKTDDKVKLGQPLIEDKECPGRFFVSPAGGTIREIRRGHKRRLLDIVIEVDQHEEIEQHPLIQLQHINRNELVESLKKSGLFTRIRQRPFNSLADPSKTPRAIFVKAIESAPFTPPADLQVEGYEKEFQTGLDTLKKLTEGSVHLVYQKRCRCRPFLEAKGVEKHTADGPHPVANVSLHIEKIDPVQSANDVIWTVDTHAVISLGYFILKGHNFVSKVISIAGPAIQEPQRGFFRVREGCAIADLIADRLEIGAIRLISGNPLTGHQVEAEDFLGYEDTVFCAVPENKEREFLHFFRLGTEKYTYSGAYLTGHLDEKNREYEFTTNQHGEHRPFIDSTLSNDVMPLNISTMHLVKAVMAEDFDLASKLGLLDVDSEDFALPTFVCPSKVEMVEIIKKGLRRYAADVLK